METGCDICKVEIQIFRIQEEFKQEELKVVKNSAEKKQDGKVVDIKPASNEKAKAM